MKYVPAPDEQVWIGVLRLVLHVPGSTGLKDRRRAVQSLLQRVASRHGAAVADVGHLDNAAVAVLAATVVANDPKVVRARLDAIRNEADQDSHGYVGSSDLWISRMGEKGNLVDS